MFDLNDRYVAIRDEAQEVARSVRAFAAEADASNVIHDHVRQVLADSGLCALMVPGEFGGRFADIDPLAVCVTREALMAESSHLDSLFALQGIGSFAISRVGTPEQKQQWLPRVATLDAVAGLALTEPEAGSDLKSVTTEITDDGDGLVVNGAKSFISNAGAADFYVVLAREGDGHSTVLVPADAPGVSTTPSPELIAPHVLGDVVLDQVRVPVSARLGGAGEGFDAVLATLATFRVSVAGASIGLAQAALEEATRHARDRHQFGRPLLRQGPVAALLADSWSEIEAARLLTYRAASRAAEDPLAALPESSMAKLLATETASKVVDRCVQVMGRWGLVHDAKIERLYRQARPMRIYEGASEVLRLGIARELAERV